MKPSFKHHFWDTHSCVPLSIHTDLNCLKTHYDAGVRAMSLNIAMDMTDTAQAIQIIASFRKQIQEIDFLMQLESIQSVDDAFLNNKLAVSFDIEGANCCNEDPNMIGLMKTLGVRQIHFAYNRNNSLGGGCHDLDQGLSLIGKKFVDAINENHILMDVSHTGYQTSMDIFNYSPKPVIYSHANPFELVQHERNIKNDQIDACIESGGIVCINGVARFLGDINLSADTFASHIDFIVQRSGIDAVGIGLDYCYPGDDDFPIQFDHNYWWPPTSDYSPEFSKKYFNPSGLIKIKESLSQLNYSDADIEKVMGGNFYRVAAQIWS